jgi:hypothetical protein
VSTVDAIPSLALAVQSRIFDRAAGKEAVGSQVPVLLNTGARKERHPSISECGQWRHRWVNPESGWKTWNPVDPDRVKAFGMRCAVSQGNP